MKLALVPLPSISPNTGIGQNIGKTKHGRNVSASSSDRSMSPLPPKLQNFSGDPTKGSWSSFFIKFERIADCHKWSDEKKLERLFGCLTDKALAYAFKCKNNKRI